MQIELHLVGKLLIEKPINLNALKRTINIIWNLKESVIIKPVDSNVFIFQLLHWKDKERVMEGRPWCFEQRLLLLQEISNDTVPSKVTLNFSLFWVRLYNLSFGSVLWRG